MRPLPVTVVCDFDDTAAAQNVARMLLDRFAEGREMKHLEDFRAGRATFREYQERGFNEVHASIAVMEAYVRENASLRPGFHEAVDAAREAGAGFVIVSAGLEFYVRALLDREGHSSLPAIAVKASQAGPGAGARIRYDYPVPCDGCAGDWAVCKCRVVEAARAGGSRVIFAGDGLRSDACAAAKADVVFARSRLLEHCRAQGIKAAPFEDLFPVSEFLKGLKGWLNARTR